METSPLICRANQWTGFYITASITNNHNVRMYAPANQAPNFHYSVNYSRQKLTARIMWKQWYVWSFLLWQEHWWAKLFTPFERRGYTFDYNVISKSIPWKSISTFVVSPGWGPLPLVIGSSWKTKLTFSRKNFKPT